MAATVEERAHRKRRLIKGPREFRDVRGDQPEKEELTRYDRAQV